MSRMPRLDPLLAAVRLRRSITLARHSRKAPVIRPPANLFAMFAGWVSPTSSVGARRKKETKQLTDLKESFRWRKFALRWES